MDNFKKKNVYVFDLDGTICTHQRDYHNARPFYDRIAKINKLYDEGHTIIIDTDRGIESGHDWKHMTEIQLDMWKLKYNYLRVGGKFRADFYIDDRSISADNFFEDKL